MLTLCLEFDLDRFLRPSFLKGDLDLEPEGDLLL
jgi:hypothetical protein